MAIPGTINDKVLNALIESTDTPGQVGLVVLDSDGSAISGGGGGAGGTEYAEDTPATAAEKLTMAGVVRKDTAASLVDTDADRTELIVDASGRLYVNASGVAVPITDNSGSITVDDGAGSLTVDGTVTIQDGGNVISVDDGAGSLTVDGTVAVSNFPSATVWTIYDSAALEASKVIKSSAGTLKLLTVYNSGPGQWFGLKDATSVPANGALVAKEPQYVPSKGVGFWDYGESGQAFTTGITIYNSTVDPSASKTLGAADCLFHAEYL